MLENPAPKNRAHRARTFLKGMIYYDSRRITVECVVRDLSETGARISVSRNVTIPDNFELEVPAKERVYRAQVRRRDEQCIGVTFNDQRSGAERRETDRAINQRVIMLEQELRALRKATR